jgi:hypothetical protein
VAVGARIVREVGLLGFTEEVYTPGKGAEVSVLEKVWMGRRAMLWLGLLRWLMSSEQEKAKIRHNAWVP